jgi:hypothetical protein
MNQLLTERGGRKNLDIVSQLRIEDYATAQIQLGKVTRRLETLGAVSTAGNKRSSLVDTYNLFSARVERLAQELPEPLPLAARQGDGGNRAETDDELIAKAADLLRRALRLKDLKQPLPATGPGTKREPRDESDLEADDAPAETQPAPVDAPAPAACPYCHRHPCVGPEHDLFSLLHHDDPEQQKKRDARATAEMMVSLRRGLGPWDL